MSGGMQGRSFDELYQALYGPLCRHACRLGASTDEAHDFVQDAFAKLYTSLLPIRNPKPWLYKTVTHLYISSLRRHRRWLGVIEKIGGATQSEEPAPHSVIEPDASSVLEACVRQLPPHQQTMLRWSLSDGLTQPQIAERLGKSQTQVSRDLKAVRESLRDMPELREFWYEA